jgi:nucleotide-binding universal stress UspA family protein
MYATLMVHLELGRPNTALLQVAGGMAERLRAAVIGVAVCQPMPIIYNDGYIPSDLIDQDRQQIDDEMKTAEAEFRTALAGRAEISNWRSIVTSISLSTQLANEARSTDLVITGVGGKASLFDTSRHLDIGDFVMQAGRPCLIVPAKTERLALEHVVVGWKDTGETRRAVRDALPLLKEAGRVTVVEIAVEQDLADARTRVQDVVGWLKRHGIEATPAATLATGDDAVGLEAVIRGQAADLIVAGAYGHSRLREWVLGGVTRDLLLRAGRCSLVSH